MWKNYWLTAWRNIRRHPGYSLINLFGLAVGISSCILILLWVRNEMSYDRFHAHAGSIQRVVVHASDPGGGSESFAVLPPSLGPALKAEFPEVRLAARHLYVGQQILGRGDRRYYEKGVSLVDPEFLRIFTFPLRRGDAASALADPRSIVVTESAAARYFGAEDPLGKTLRLNNRDEYTVAGVLADIPAQSHLTFDVLLPIASAPDFGYLNETWERFSYETYVQLEDGADARSLEKKIARRLQKPLADDHIVLRLQPLADIHLRSAGMNEGETRGDIRIVYLFSLLALLILLMACINYLNLAVAQGGARAKEIGLRKVTGAGRGEIIAQFLGESLLQAALAMTVAMVLVAAGLPFLNALSGKHLSLFSLLSPAHALLLAGFLLLTGLLAGLYPALYLSRFRPAAVLKGRLAAAAGGSRFRKGLVVFQFSLTIALIIGSASVFRQLRFVRTQALGFDQAQVVMIPLRGNLGGKVGPLKAEMLRDSHVAAAAAASDPVMMFGSAIIMDDWDGRLAGQQVKFDIAYCDEDYLKVHGIGMAEGRFFSPAVGGNPEGQVVINESGAAALGFTRPVGRRLMGKEIIGVVRDFHARSLHSATGPMALWYKPSRFAYLFVKIRPGNAAAALASLAGTWKRAAPDHPFDFAFLDQRIDQLYRADQRLGTVVNAFAFLALLIANLGLLGMASYLTSRRTKEIGVRKALGANTAQIMAMLSREFVQWVAVAALIACPAAYVVLDRWLRTFAYRAPVGIGVSALSSLLALALALATIGYHSVRAARANPVDSLRYE